jgi:hypothetical protein
MLRWSIKAFRSPQKQETLKTKNKKTKKLGGFRYPVRTRRSSFLNTGNLKARETRKRCCDAVSTLIEI